MSLKTQNSVMFDYPLAGLPPDWRKRVEAVALSVGATYDLYVTRAQAGARRSPEGIILSIAMEGADSSWNPKVVEVLRSRIRAVLDAAKVQEVEREEARRRIERAVDGGGLGGLEGELPAVEDRRGRTDAQLHGLRARRKVFTLELRAVLSTSELPPPARAFAEAALRGMQDPEQWALWAQLVLVVSELRERLGPGRREQLEALL